MLQKNPDQLQQLEDRWLMRLSPDKCEVLRVTNRRYLLPANYSIHGQVLNTIDSAKYLGVTLQKKKMVDNITKKPTLPLLSLKETSAGAQKPSKHNVLHTNKTNPGVFR